ncbi:hypothetical protein D9M70_581130 [compost metagenome]
MNRLAVILLLTCLWLPIAQADDAPLQQLQQLRSLGFNVCASVLVQFTTTRKASIRAAPRPITPTWPACGRSPKAGRPYPSRP